MNWHRFWRSFSKRRGALLGAGLIVLYIVFAVAAPWISPYDPLAQDLTNALKPPDSNHLLGTDRFGRDVLSRTIWSTRVSLQIGLYSVLLGAFMGVIIGLTSGYYGGRVDTILMRLNDIGMAFPMLLLAIAIVAAMGRGLPNLIIAIAFSNVPRFARVVRGEVLAIREIGYVEAAKALGASPARIAFVHMLPNLLNTTIVMMTLRISFAILTEASLSFLGLGLPPPTPSWGGMLAEGQRMLAIAPWISMSAGVAVAVLVFACNLIGDGLRDALDPRLI